MIIINAVQFAILGSGMVLASLGGAAVKWLNGHVDRDEWLLGLGLSFLGVGIGAIYWPVALIVVGLVFLYLAWEGARRGDTSRDSSSSSGGSGSGP